MQSKKESVNSIDSTDTVVGVQGDGPQLESWREQIESWREQIDRIDRSILELLNIRMDICRAIGQHKRQNGYKVILDEARENAIISALDKQSKYDRMVASIWPYIFEFSRSLQ